MSGPDLRALFADEAAELLARLSTGALDLERGATREQLNDLFRAAHTLKGSAALVGLDDVASTAHLLEDLLDRLRSGEAEAGPAVVDVVLATVDDLRRAIPGALAGRPAGSGAADATVGVPVGRLDRLVRLTGEARTAHLRLDAALGAAAAADPVVDEALADLDRLLAELQGQTLAARMVTLAQIAEPLRRAARDVARTTGKEVDYALEGERVELDRAVLDGLREPLLHLVRNAVDHGLEPPGERQAAGKPRAGRVRVAAHRHGGDLVVTVSDDGRGFDVERLRATLPGAAGLRDDEVLDRLFAPGISTAERVTEVSGRGVGLDAVRTGLAAVRGTVRAAGEPGRGATFTITVPVTLAVVRCLLLRVGNERYALPVHAIAEVAAATSDDLDLATALGAATAATGPRAVVLRAAGRRVALRVDELLGQRDVAVQELGGALGRLELVAGATIAPEGQVVLVLDPVALALRAAGLQGAAAAPVADVAGPAPGAPTVLLVDDAPTVLALQRRMLEHAGYEVLTAPDGAAALAVLDDTTVDLVITDLEMPRMGGLQLLEALRRDRGLASLPVLVVSSRDDAEHRRRALYAGASGYLAKQELRDETLLPAVERLLGGRRAG